jgi:hypothetical protein
VCYLPIPLVAISVAIAISVGITVTVMLVVMPAVSHHAPIGNPDIERTFQTEGDERIPRNPHCSTPDLAAMNGSDNCTYEAVVAPRFNTVGICVDSIAHARTPLMTPTFQQRTVSAPDVYRMLIPPLGP